uniref:Protein phosphatase methylesterase 1 n=2 Tax=Ascaris TaxID=6251 RepID=A0A0M3HNS6_ASCLU
MSKLEREMFSKKGLAPIDENSSLPVLPLPPEPKEWKIKRDLSPLSWDAFFDKKLTVGVGEDKFCVYVKGNTGPVFYLLHGAGYSGLTWACFTEELSAQVECRVVAPDLRGHGETVTVDGVDFSKDRQVEDIVAIHKSIFGEQSTPTFVIGHSMGGALAVHTVHSGRIDSVVGLGVIDVVEGSAMESLSLMNMVLSNRPHSFRSVEAAVDWCVKTGTARNLRSARVSMPSQIMKSNNGYTWRINLHKTQPYWVDWFRGLSKLFLACSVPKILVLAGVDRLDTDLMVGQMQGKFQNTILPKVGHAVQEDSPDQLAETLARFAVRFRFCTAK